jgi:hypothetical protein
MKKIVVSLAALAALSTAATASAFNDAQKRNAIENGEPVTLSQPVVSGDALEVISPEGLTAYDKARINAERN